MTSSSARYRRRLLLQGLLAGAAMILTAATVLVPARTGTEAVRMRNALQADAGTFEDAQWTPGELPPGFKTDHGAPPPASAVAFVAAHGGAAGDGDFARALSLARALLATRPHGGAIQSDFATALERITNRGTGYCADYTQVMTGLALAAGIPIREWGMSFDGYGGNGHAFVEVYDRTAGKWMFLDAFYGFYVTDSAGTPLSVLEFRDALADPARWPRLERIVPAFLAFKGANQAFDYYRRGLAEPYMVWGVNNFSYERAPLVRLTGRWSRYVEQFAAIASGVQPRLRLLIDNRNLHALKQLMALRTRLIVSAAVLLLLAVALVRVALQYLSATRVRP